METNPNRIGKESMEGLGLESSYRVHLLFSKVWVGGGEGYFETFPVGGPGGILSLCFVFFYFPKQA